MRTELGSLSRVNASCLSEYFDEISIVPASLFAFSLDSDCSRFLLREEIECDLAHQGEVLWSMVFADTAVIFGKGDIEYPVQGVFNPPVRANGFEDGFSPVGQRTDEVTCRCCDVLIGA